MKNTVCLVAVVLCCAGVGCAGLNDSRNMRHSMVNSMSPTPENRSDAHRDENRIDREQEDMMLDARQDLSKSKEPDKWWSEQLHSPEARSIERSLGVQYY